ncbi:hypothetical protein [Streptomyces alboflavus]|uniref:hypothetical protein n=1 Tax=Streptomyces alboflavus TaxID=67267 RepID=UPI000690C4DA|nr:hypothetical protein [Streptomyces alboflavus]
MKTRTIKRKRLVPHTLDGKTRMVPDEEITQVPLPPRDWDQIALNTVTVIVTTLVIACVVWSTVSIGDLLDRVVAEPAAYGAAAVFDLAWIALMIIEWLARYTPSRARPAQIGGGIALVVAMGAVGTHGWLAGNAATGIVGAVVSGLAKGTWTILLAYQSAPLDNRTAAFLEQELGEAGAELARIPVVRRVNRARAIRDAETRALEAADEAVPRASTPAEARDTAQPPLSTELRGAAGTPVDDLSTLHGTHGPVVYFLASGNHIKISTTRGLPDHSDLRCAIHGGPDIQRRMHALFAPYRVGDTDWFENTGDLASFIDQHTHASPDTPDDAHDASPDADDANPDAPQVSEPQQPPVALPQTSNKTELILYASSMLQPDAHARPADIALLLAQNGHAVDTAYIRTVLSRNPRPEDGVGKGGGGYA